MYIEHIQYVSVHIAYKVSIYVYIEHIQYVCEHVAYKVSLYVYIYSP